MEKWMLIDSLKGAGPQAAASDCAVWSSFLLHTWFAAPEALFLFNRVLIPLYTDLTSVYFFFFKADSQTCSDLLNQTSERKGVSFAA